MENSQDKKPIEPSLDGIHQQARKTAAQDTVSPGLQRRRTALFQIYMVATSLLFLWLALLARTEAYLDLDLIISQFIQSFDSPWFAALMVGVSWPGFAPQTLLITGFLALLMIWLGYSWEGLVSMGAAVGVHVLNFLVKLIVARPRPASNLISVIEELSSYSFPSGHVMFYTVFFGFLFFLAFTLLKHSWRRTLLLLFFGALVALVGLSRVYLGQHWASDVIGGYLLGSLSLAAVIQVYRWGKSHYILGRFDTSR